MEDGCGRARQNPALNAKIKVELELSNFDCTTDSIGPYLTV